MMYNDISNVFLNNIKAIRFYVNSVDQTMDNHFSEKLIDSDEAFTAVMIYMIAKAKERGIEISNTSQSLENIPQEAVDYIKEIVNLVHEIECDEDKIPLYRYLPKDIKKEYQKIEIIEKQKEILYRGSLLLLVTYFENLIAGVLRENFKKYPQRILLNEKSVSYRMLTEVNDIEEIKNILIDQEVTSKMYGSLLDWKNYFQKNIKLNLKVWDDQFDELQEIIARRNLYVHNNGIINNIYIQLVNNIDKVSIGKYLNIDREYVDNAVNIIEYIGISLLIEVWLKEYADNPNEVKKITGLIYEEYLESQRWDVARHFYEICLQNSKISNADEVSCKINKWQCYKWLGEYDKIKNEVEKLDVSAYLPMYTLGILALKEEYTKFFEFYDTQTEICEKQLEEWPLFKELRKSEEYMKRFPKTEIEEKEEVNEIEYKDTEDVTD